MVKVAVCKASIGGGEEVGTLSGNLKSLIFKRLLEITVIFKWEATERTTWISLVVALHSFYMNESSYMYSQIPTKLGFYVIF